jgi:hypothetical protein
MIPFNKNDHDWLVVQGDTVWWIAEANVENDRSIVRQNNHTAYDMIIDMPRMYAYVNLWVGDHVTVLIHRDLVDVPA